MRSAGPGVVGLSVGGPRPAPLDNLIFAIGRESGVVNIDGYPGRVDWMLVYRSPLKVPETVPAVWYLEDASDVSQVHRPSLVLSTDQVLLDACETKAPKLLMTRTTTRYDHAKPFAPYPRERIRRARGLPSIVIGAVAEQHNRWNGHQVGPKFTDTILMSSSSVICDQTSVLGALAFGAPTVTDPATAAAVGAHHDKHLLIGSDQHERERLAAELAGDMARSARLSWAGRMLFEHSHSTKHLIQRIELAVTKCAGPAARISRELAVMGTPDDAPIRSRSARLYNLPRAPHPLRPLESSDAP